MSKVSVTDVHWTADKIGKPHACGADESEAGTTLARKITCVTCRMVAWNAFAEAVDSGGGRALLTRETALTERLHALAGKEHDANLMRADLRARDDRCREKEWALKVERTEFLNKEKQYRKDIRNAIREQEQRRAKKALLNEFAEVHRFTTRLASASLQLALGAGDERLAAAQALNDLADQVASRIEQLSK